VQVHFIGQLIGYFFKRWSQGSARAAPRGPEVHHHGFACRSDRGGERFFVKICDLAHFD
jgi:hypothetical protein